MRAMFRRVVEGFICWNSASTILVSSLLTATLLVAVPQMAWAATYTVCKAGGAVVCHYESPELAVNDPGIADGDTINITTDTYVLGATLQVDNSITILANDSTFDSLDEQPRTVHQ